MAMRYLLAMVMIGLIGCGDDGPTPTERVDETWEYLWSIDGNAPTMNGTMTLQRDGLKTLGILRAPDGYPSDAHWDMGIKGDSPTELRLITDGIPSWSLTCETDLAPTRMSCEASDPGGATGTFLGIRTL